MTAEIYELSDSRGFRGNSQSARERRKRYVIEGTNDEEEVDTLLRATAPAEYLGLPVQDYSADPDITEYRWICQVSYAVRDEWSFAIDNIAGTEHMAVSLETTQKKYRGGVGAFDFNGAINVSGDSVAGVDAYSAKQQFTVIRYVEKTEIDTAYLDGIDALCKPRPHFNHETVTIVIEGITRTYAAGELLFLGYSLATSNTKTHWEIRYEFLASMNLAGVSLAGIGPFDKKGFEYLWPCFDDDVDNNSPVRVPKALFVERLYDEGDFAAISLPAS